MNIKHIFFDLDHTLWDFETNSNKTFEFIFKKNSINVNFINFKEIYKPINQRYWKLYRDNLVTKEELRYQRLKEAFNELNFYTDDYLINLLAEEYIEYLPTNKTLFEGAIEILDYLQPNYQMHIITNGFEEVQHKKLESSKMLPYFNNIITSEKVGAKKPNPKIFHYALEISGAKSEESIMIGDNFEADILGAKSVGMHTVFCEFNGDVASEKVLTISKLIHLKRYL